jgi:hypothetical protein
VNGSDVDVQFLSCQVDEDGTASSSSVVIVEIEIGPVRLSPVRLNALGKCNNTRTAGAGPRE